ncbi:MAG: hypothetical protein HY735_10960 [Verrucomicrobia bacterium]|nr:hypothetical protein [Verrucomicrobiota bacterium]
MKSHEYEFSLFEVLKLAGAILAPLGMFALAMHLGATANLLPDPRPNLDIDRTILLHQAEASRSKHEADLVLIGDSSCLMDVSAPELAAALPGHHRVLNLGTLSYLDLPAYASMLRHYTAANPNQLKILVLLMHPEALRRLAPEEHHVEMLNRHYSGADYCGPVSSPMICWIGGPIFKGRLLSRLIPVPLAGAYGWKYGFTADLWEYLSAHDGSAVDPGKFDRATAKGNSEYSASLRLEAASRTFRAAVPTGVRLMVGMTPAPESFVPPTHGERYREMLSRWSQWLAADAALAGLPPTLPDDLFASTTHLDEAGQRLFTGILAQNLTAQLQRQ